MQAEENSDSEGEEGQAFYAGGSERRYVYVTVVLVKFGFRLTFLSQVDFQFFLSSEARKQIKGNEE